MDPSSARRRNSPTNTAAEPSNPSTMQAPSSKLRYNRKRRNHQPPLGPSLWTFRGLVLTTAAFVAVIMVLVGYVLLSSGDKTYKTLINTSFTSPSQIADDLLQSLDAVVLLGGGAPSSLYEPPLYVQERCKDTLELLIKRRSSLPILCLSAGTAHVPQLLSADGLPVYESTSSAAYLQRHGVASDLLYVETTSYDTIGNAFFARTSHTDLAGWRNLLIVTNEVSETSRMQSKVEHNHSPCCILPQPQFHMERSKAIFDWIFTTAPVQSYKLYYLSSPDTGLSESALEARREREARSLVSVQKLSQEYRTMSAVWSFLNTKHDLYTAKTLIQRGAAKTAKGEAVSDEIKKSYGGA